MEPFIGQIIMFGGNFAPRGWALCNGQLLGIADNQALFSILGTTYGGDGRTTFGLPDLRGRVPMHPGAGPGLTPRALGQKGGSEDETLVPGQIPPHSHPLRGVVSAGNSGEPAGKALGMSGEEIYSDAPVDTDLSADAVANAGGGQAHNNVQPFQTVNFIIALVGTFPSRN